VFNVLGQFFEGGVVLDLFSGTGAMALEALSRGCERAICVESGREAARVLQKNAAACGFSDRVEVREEPVENVLPHLRAGAFDLIFLDPPYAVGGEGALSAAGRLLAPGGRAVAEHDRRRPPAERYGSLLLVDRRSYGDTGISIYRGE
jgi:16S rRNA (guanine(966)-N(2))-methyltransferase RsmD